MNYWRIDEQPLVSLSEPESDIKLKEKERIVSKGSIFPSTDHSSSDGMQTSNNNPSNSSLGGKPKPFMEQIVDSADGIKKFMMSFTTTRMVSARNQALLYLLLLLLTNEFKRVLLIYIAGLPRSWDTKRSVC